MRLFFFAWLLAVVGCQCCSGCEAAPPPSEHLTPAEDPPEAPALPRFDRELNAKISEPVGEIVDRSQELGHYVELPRERIRVVVYTRPGCPPCKRLKEDVERSAELRRRFVWTFRGEAQAPPYLRGFPELYWRAGGKPWRVTGWHGERAFLEAFEDTLDGQVGN